jgi:hypothetical protein
MASSASAMRPAVASLAGVAGRFVAVIAGFREAGLEGVRAAVFAAVFLGFFDIFPVPDRAALTGLGSSRKRPK